MGPDEPTAVALTRLAPPRVRAGSVVRRRLVDRLLTSDASLVVVRGPAGSGKSTLMAEAYDQAPHAVWLSASRRDADPAVFWTALIDSTAQVLPGFGDEYRHRLDVVGAGAVDDLVPLVVNELARAGRPGTLFIDDVHLLTGDATRRSLLQFLELRPARLRVVLGGRGAAPVPLGRFRLQGHLVEVTTDDLAMDTGEARELMTAASVAVDDGQLAQLLERTEGWAAGLAWAAMALRERGDIDGFVAALAANERMIASYLIEEVVDRLPHDVQQFMLDTSILASFSAELCDAVRARTDAGVLLKKLEDSHSFVIELDRAGQWYRYHHLVHVVLAAELRRRRPTKIVDLHRRASAWHAEHGDVPEAVHHALAAGAQVEAADMVCATWWDLVGAGRGETAGLLFDLFGSDEIRAYQPLAIAAAEFYSVAGNRALGKQYYDAALRGHFDGVPPDGSASIESSVGIMRAALVFEGVAQSVVDAELTYRLEGPDGRYRVFAALFVGLATVWLGDGDAAMPYFEEVVAAIPPSEPLVVYALAEISLAHLARGDLAAAEDYADSAVTRAEAAGIETLFLSATAYGAQALAQLAVGNQRAAATALRSANAPMELVESAMPIDALRARILLADAAIQLGFNRLAVAHVERAEQIDRQTSDAGVLSAQLAALRVRLDEMIGAGTGGVSFSGSTRHVLELLPTEMTVREIGAELFLSKNTIKTHVRRIYHELGVSRREDAVVRARQLGLLAQE